MWFFFFRKKTKLKLFVYFIKFLNLITNFSKNVFYVIFYEYTFLFFIKYLIKNKFKWEDAIFYLNYYFILFSIWLLINFYYVILSYSINILLIFLLYSYFNLYIYFNILFLFFYKFLLFTYYMFILFIIHLTLLFICFFTYLKLYFILLYNLFSFIVITFSIFMDNTLIYLLFFFFSNLYFFFIIFVLYSTLFLVLNTYLNKLNNSLFSKSPFCNFLFYIIYFFCIFEIFISSYNHIFDVALILYEIDIIFLTFYCLFLLFIYFVYYTYCLFIFYLSVLLLTEIVKFFLYIFVNNTISEEWSIWDTLLFLISFLLSFFFFSFFSLGLNVNFIFDYYFTTLNDIKSLNNLVKLYFLYR